MGSWKPCKIQPSSEIRQSSLRRANAQAFTSQKTYSSFDTYLWSFVEEKRSWMMFLTIARHLLKNSLVWRKISQRSKKRGFKFTGPVAVLSFLQLLVWLMTMRMIVSGKTEISECRRLIIWEYREKARNSSQLFDYSNFIVQWEMSVHLRQRQLRFR